jgi:tetratricopeptide (TPR) repeat protein
VPARLRNELASQPQVKARLLDAISRIYRQLGLYDEAVTLARESLALSQAPDSGDPAEAAEGLLNLGTIYQLQGRGDAAEPLLRRALAAFEGTGDRAAIAACKMELASVAAHRGRYAEAERLSLETVDDWTAALGPDSERVGAALNNLANMYYTQRRWADAEHAHLRAIAIKTKVFGEEHYYVAQSMSNLANVLVEEGRLAEAEALAQKALAIKRRVLPPTHFEIGVSIHNLGDVALKGGHAERAAELYAQAIAFWESIPGAGKAYVSYS